MSLTIKLHEAKVDYSGSRVSKSVADAYALLDDYFCDDSGNLSKDAIEKVMLTFKNERDLYDRSKSNAVKSHALAWDALLREIKATLEWDDETPHATNLSSEQVKNWFKLKGRDFREDLKPLVDAIDRQRKEWWGAKESKKNEAYSDYDAIRDWLEGVMGKAGTMFESAYVSENRPGEICAEIEGYDSTGGDAIISLVWNAGEDFAETISAMADELVEYAEDFDPEEEAEMYSNSGMAGVPALRQLLKAMDERKEDMVSLAGTVSLAASKL